MRPLTEEQLYDMSLKHEPLRNRAGTVSTREASDDEDDIDGEEGTCKNPLFGKRTRAFMRSGKPYAPDPIDLISFQRSTSEVGLDATSPRKKSRLKRRSSAVLGKLAPRFFENKKESE